MSDYNLKYIKYKTKYLELKGGGLLFKQINLKAVKVNGLALKYLSKDAKADEDIVLAAVTQNGLALKFASDKLKANKKIVLVALSQNLLAFNFVPDKVRKADDIALVYNKLYFITYANDSNIRKTFIYGDQYYSLYGVKDVILAMVIQDGKLLEYASDKLKSDREVVLAAMNQNELALRYASDKLTSNREFVSEAVSQNGIAYLYASEELQLDPFIIAQYKAYLITNAKIPYVRKDFIIYLKEKKNLNNKLNTDKEVMLAMVKQDGLMLEYASNELKLDIEVVLAAVKQNGLARRFASNNIMKTI